LCKTAQLKVPGNQYHQLFQVTTCHWLVFTENAVVYHHVHRGWARKKNNPLLNYEYIILCHNLRKGLDWIFFLSITVSTEHLCYEMALNIGLYVT